MTQICLLVEPQIDLLIRLRAKLSTLALFSTMTRKQSQFSCSAAIMSQKSSIRIFYKQKYITRSFSTAIRDVQIRAIVYEAA